MHLFISRQIKRLLLASSPDQVLCPSRARRSTRHSLSRNLLLLVTLSAVLDVTAISHKCSVLLERV